LKKKPSKKSARSRRQAEGKQKAVYFRQSSELYQLYDGPGITEVMEGRKLRWLGYILTTNETHPNRQLSF
jgi:hypothetical protein